MDQKEKQALLSEISAVLYAMGSLATDFYRAQGLEFGPISVRELYTPKDKEEMGIKPS